MTGGVSGNGGASPTGGANGTGGRPGSGGRLGAHESASSVRPLLGASSTGDVAGVEGRF